MVWKVNNVSKAPQTIMNQIMTSAEGGELWRVVSTMADVPSGTNWTFTKAGTNVMKEIPAMDISENKGWVFRED